MIQSKSALTIFRVFLMGVRKGLNYGGTAGLLDIVQQQLYKELF